MSSATLPRSAPAPQKRPAPEATPGRPDRTFAARRWIRPHRARLERWPVWRFASGVRDRLGDELQLLASDPRQPEQPPADPRALYRGLYELAAAARAAVPEPPEVRVEVRPYTASLVVVPGPPPVFEVPLSVEVLARQGAGADACRRHAAALEAHLATLGLKRR